MHTEFPVRVNQRTFAPHEQDPSNAQWVRAVAGAHRKDATFCLCRPQEPVRLTIRLHGAGSGKSRYWLAKWPNTGLEHDPQCAYFGEEEDSANLPGTSRPAFEELAGGKTRVHLATSLATGAASTVATGVQTPSSAAAQQKRTRASEITLLQQMWRDARLNVSPVKSRTWFHSCYALLKCASGYVVNKAGDTLCDYLLIASALNDELARVHNLAVLTQAERHPRKLFVLGRLRTAAGDKPRMLLPVKDFGLLPKILVDRNTVERFLHGRAFYQNILRNEVAGEVIILATIEPASAGWWTCTAITGIATSKQMIPVESSYEIEMDDYLQRLSRRYLKPMVTAELEGEELRPDFILLDTDPLTRIEVWGMQTPEYLEDKAARIVHYAYRHQALISWSANPREPLPLLPSPSSSTLVTP